MEMAIHSSTSFLTFVSTIIIFSSLLVSLSSAKLSQPSRTVCILGSGIGGSSVAHFLRKYSNSNPYNAQIGQIRVFERHGIVGGRMATVTIAGETFEAGASILHPKNYHALTYAKFLNLTIKEPSSSSSGLGIWNGREFIFKTAASDSENWIIQYLFSFANSLKVFMRYGHALFRMHSFVERTVNRFLKYYMPLKSRPEFETVEEMLNWAGLYSITQRTLVEELVVARLSSKLIRELVTVITRINYGQSISISGLAGVVSLAGSGGGLWSIRGGNWQMAAGLINHSNVLLHLNEEIKSVSYFDGFYELNSSKGESYTCDITVIATPLDELNIHFKPEISIPKRTLQHTYTTFIRGLVNPKYFGLNRVSDIPELIGTIETSDVPFSSISVIKRHDKEDMTYKIFSRQPMQEALLDDIFSVRKETIRIDWAAYPHYHAPERFAPIVLDGHHLYYLNAFENAASTMETSAVAAENIARLILSRLSRQRFLSASILNSAVDLQDSHLDL